MRLQSFRRSKRVFTACKPRTSICTSCTGLSGTPLMAGTVVMTRERSMTPHPSGTRCWASRNSGLIRSYGLPNDTTNDLLIRLLPPGRRTGHVAVGQRKNLILFAQSTGRGRVIRGVRATEPQRRTASLVYNVRCISVCKLQSQLLHRLAGRTRVH